MTRQRWVAVCVTLIGAVGLAVSVLARFGIGWYTGSLAVTTVGAATCAVLFARARPVLRGLLAAVVAVLLVAIGLVAVRGLPRSTPTWSKNADLSGPTARVGDLAFVADHGGVDARDVRNGARRWRAADADLLAATSGTVVVATDREVEGRDPASGAVRWSHPAPYARGIAQDGTVLVTAQNVGNPGDRFVAVGYDLASGRVVWRDDRHFPAMEIDLLNGRSRDVAALEQDTVAMFTPRGDGSDAGRPYALVRVSDGHQVLPLTSNFVGRVVGRTFVGDDPSTGNDGTVTLSGWSTSDGRRLWSVPAPKLADVAGAGPVLAMVHYTTDAPVSTADSVEILDARNGRTGRTSPPAPWRIDDVQDAQDQRGTAIWLPVSAGGHHAVWRVGAPDVVELDGEALTVPASGQSGDWTVVTGVRTDAVGERSPVAWALTAHDRVFGPYPASSAYAGPGLLQTTAGNSGGEDAVIPLG